MSTIKASQIGFSYGNGYLFRNLDFSVEKGRILAILGPNGAGKTTLLKILLRSLKLSEGEITVEGQAIEKFKERELFQMLSYVPQNRNLPGSFTALETVLLGLTSKLALFRSPGEKEVEKAEETLEKLGVLSLKDRRVEELSGGETQMILMARALARDPKILILDEPESGLDFRNQLRVLETIKHLKEAGVSVIFNTHYPEHAFRYADTAVLLYGDTRSRFGAVDEIMTVENIREAFGVEVAIGTLNLENTAVRSVVPIKISNDKEKTR